MIYFFKSLWNLLNGKNDVGEPFMLEENHLDLESKRDRMRSWKWPK